jgi:E3 ubiquitin-protein ligase UBR4
LLVQPDQVEPFVAQSFHAVCCRGSRSQDFFAFLAQLMKKVSNPKAILEGLMTSVRAEFTEIQVHPDSHVYQQLSHYIDVTGSYLDEQPCAVCNNPERSPSRMKGDEVVAGQKFSPDTVFTLLKSPLLISSVLISFTAKKRSKFPRVLRFSVSADDVTDVNDLMNNARQWRVVQELDFTREKMSSIAVLALPLLATCLKFQVVALWEDTSEGQTPKCSHCNRGTPDPRSGICPACSTNSRQCRNCRAINYDADTFFCSQCGTSEYVSSEWSITAVQSFSHTRVNSAEDVTLALAKSDELLANAQTISRSLGHLRSDIVQALSQANPQPIADRINRLNGLYNEKGKNYSFN